MRALITGGTGFVGAHLVEHLVERGAVVAVLRRPTTQPWRIAHLLPRLVNIFGDLDNVAGTTRQIERFAPDIVFHLGWQGVSRAERNDPQLQAQNVTAALTLFRIAQQAGCRVFVGLGSQAEYGPQNRRLDENAPLTPITEYGRAKVRAWESLQTLAGAADVRLAWVRLFSAYGPGDNRQCLIPTLIETLLGRGCPALTAGEQLWDFLYAGDAAQALAALAQTPQAAGAFNLGRGQVTTIRHVAETLRDLIDRTLPLGLGEVPYGPDALMHLEADVSRLTAVTGWHARTPLRAGLERTIAWHRARFAAEKGSRSAQLPLIQGHAA